MDMSEVSSDRFSDTDSTLGTVDPDTICKEMLRKQVFRGKFIEKKYVPSIEDYRDLIEVNATESRIFGVQLEYVKNRLLKKNPLTWIGITMNDATPVNWTIWTKLPSSLPFGEYYFKVKTISFRHKEIHLKLKVVHDRNGSENPVNPAAATQISLEDIVDFGNRLRVVIVDQSRRFAEWMRAPNISLKDIWITIKYVAVVVLMIGAFCIEAIGMIGRFCLVMSSELRKMLHVMMPLLVRLVILVEKCFGGVLIVLTMMWRDTMHGLSGQPPPRQMQTMIDNRPHRNRYRN